MDDETEGSEDDFSQELDSGALFELLSDDEDDDLGDFFSMDDENEEESDDEDDEDDEDYEDEDDDTDSFDELSDDEGEDSDEDDDILSSFFSFSNELKTMTVFEKMRFDGRTVEPISFETLESLVQAQKERRRRELLNGSADQ